MASASHSGNTLIPADSPLNTPSLNPFNIHKKLAGLRRKYLSLEMHTSFLFPVSSPLHIKNTEHQAGSFRRRAPAPAKNASPATAKHDTSSESDSDEGSPEPASATSTPTTRSAASASGLIMTTTKQALPTTVTLVFQVGGSFPGTMVLLNSLSATPSLPTPTSTPSTLLSVTSALPSPTPLSSSHAEQLANVDTRTSDTHSNVPLIVGLLAGVLGLAVIVLAVYIIMASRRRRRERELLNMMAPSQLGNNFSYLMQVDPRQSFTFVGPIEKPTSRRGSRLAII
ncbi:hypothetical protein PCASD_22393 [Puccinia coronata f. sp. avenae]|uniref:Uncharacterized protein n=1 Tax=Puccinia coronata f. sp. avenae TaxID=200324 RepID=A0A2N5TI67_9BASI|nr:hypothetical protein PCASD_22393 [Puccinia coronata f. sp. avenae]